MNCRYVQSRMSCYIDGELTGREMLLVRNHLSRCAGCDHELEQIVQTKQLLGSLGVPRVPIGFEDRLVSAVLGAKETPTVPLWNRLVRFAKGDLFSWAVGAVGVVAVIAIYITPERQDLFTQGQGTSSATIGMAAPSADPDWEMWYRDHNERNGEFPFLSTPRTDAMPVGFGN